MSGDLIEILMVEDDPSDLALAEVALKDAKVGNRISIARDGEEALNFLFRRDGYENAPKPDLILLDLNLPRVDGRQVLAEIKNDKNLKHIPVVVLTTSSDEKDVLESYDLNANCYITKPVDFDQFREVVRTIDFFWLGIVRLPRDLPSRDD